jgi:hypothetical protein
VDRRRLGVLARQEAIERGVDQQAPFLQIGLEVEGAHCSLSGSQATGRAPSVPLSSRASTSMRFSASSR